MYNAMLLTKGTMNMNSKKREYEAPCMLDCSTECTQMLCESPGFTLPDIIEEDGVTIWED